MTYLRPETPMEASRTGWQMKHVRWHYKGLRRNNEPVRIVGY
jgi:hypothetical protein